MKTAMNTVIEANPQIIAPPPFYGAGEEIVYPESHDDDMGETNWHYALLAHLWNALQLFFADKTDAYIAANMNLYYEQGRPEFYYTPDLMAAFGVANHNRGVYKLWEEKVFPQVVFEIASNRTWKDDLSEKVEAYGKLGAEEYYVLDSQDFLPLPLMAYRRENGRLKLLRLEEDRVFSPRLGLEIMLTKDGFRFLDPNKQEFLPTLTDAQAEAQAAKIRAEAEAAKAKVETLRADAAETKVAQLLAEIARMKGKM